MDQIEDSTADHHHRRRRKQPTKIRCFLGCFGGGGASQDEKLPRRKFKSINQSRWFSSCFKSRSKKSPKRTVPVESQSSTDEKANNEKGRRVLGWSKSNSNKMVDELPVKGEDGIMIQPPVAGDVLHEKANKKRSGKGILMRNSKSMNHIEVLEPIEEEAATPTSLRKSKSAKIATTVNQPSGGDSQLITEEISISLSQSQSQSQSVVADDEQEVSGRGRGEDGDDDENNNKVKKREEKKKKGSIDRVVGISIIVMVLVIMAVWGKLCAILCSAAWLYFYPLLLGVGANHNNNGTQHLDDVVAQTKDSSKSLQIVHGNPHCQKNEGCL